MAFATGEASSSSLPSGATPRSWTYQVFLSFRGQDTRKGFTDHLYASLKRKGITTLRDDKDLERGDVISQELLKAIEGSMFAITVLSPNYASSTWCLDELQQIVDCSKNKGLSVVPVFYGVDPSDVRHQKGNFVEAFRKHEQRFGQDSEKVKRWRAALTQIASYSGWDSKNQHEARLVESIAEHIHKKLIPKLPSCIESHVGVASRMEVVIRLVSIGLNDVCFVGIWGMGGIGKTTIARAVYETIQDEFEVHCFMRNVRELSEINGFVHLQRDLLSRLNISNSDFYDIEDGRRIIKSSLCNKKVLLVLDDVSQEIQLKNLAWRQDWFGPGSRIIITARDMHLLNRHGVHGTYEVKGLDQKEAHHLFCLKAFKQPEPIEGYSSLSKEVVEYTKGLPLAIEILGSYLYGRDIDFWYSTITEIKNGPHFEIFEALKISYNHLTPIEKNIFLDVACFFKGEDKDEVTRILKICGHYVGIGSGIRSGIITLIDKSLLSLDQYNRLEMHDLLQEMGKHVVYEESPNNPGRRSRLWSKNDIDQVLTNDMGTEAIQGIVLSSDYDARWNTEAFLRISQLKFLRLPRIRLPLGLKYLPRSLKVLHWDCCLLETLPLADQPYEVVEMKLQFSDIKQLWHGKKFLEKLKHLDLSYSYHLKQTPDLTGVPNLETLDLSRCYDLTEVHLSLIHHKNLVLLNLSSCRSLETLPGKLEMSSLQELIIEYCDHFENPPEFGECMEKLSRLSLRYIPIRKLPMSLGCLVGLKDLDIKACVKLDCLPDTIHRLKSLEALYAGCCWSLHGLATSVSRLCLLRTLDLSCCDLTDESFPHDFGHFMLLMDLDLSHNFFVSIPINIHELPKLRCLRLNGCAKLQFLPKLPPCIRELEAYRCDSLYTSESNILSTACNVFKSPRSQGHARVLRMVIPGREIPPWFVHRENVKCVSVPHPRNCPLSESVGIALCFLLLTLRTKSSRLMSFSVRNGNRFITSWCLDIMGPSYHLCILYLTNDCFSDEFRQENRFEQLIEDVDSNDAKILSSAARWVSIDDVEDLNKRETERPEKKRQKVVDLNKSIEEMDL